MDEREFAVARSYVFSVYYAEDGLVYLRALLPFGVFHESYSLNEWANWLAEEGKRAKERDIPEIFKKSFGDDSEKGALLGR